MTRISALVKWEQVYKYLSALCHKSVWERHIRQGARSEGSSNYLQLWHIIIHWMACHSDCHNAQQRACTLSVLSSTQRGCRSTGHLGKILCSNPGTSLLLFVKRIWQHKQGEHQLVTNNQQNSSITNGDIWKGFLRWRHNSVCKVITKYYPTRYISLGQSDLNKEQVKHSKICMGTSVSTVLCTKEKKVNQENVESVESEEAQIENLKSLRKNEKK